MEDLVLLRSPPTATAKMLSKRPPQPPAAPTDTRRMLNQRGVDQPRLAPDLFHEPVACVAAPVRWLWTRKLVNAPSDEHA